MTESESYKIGEFLTGTEDTDNIILKDSVYIADCVSSDGKYGIHIETENELDCGDVGICEVLLNYNTAPTEGNLITIKSGYIKEL